MADSTNADKVAMRAPSRYKQFMQRQCYMFLGLALCTLLALTACESSGSKDKKCDATASCDDAAAEPDSGPNQSSDAGMDSSIGSRDAGGDAGGPDGALDAARDASVDFGSFACNPLTQVPCNTNERCAWSQPAVGTGTLNCVANSAVAEGDACTTDSNGLGNCGRGLHCLRDRCTRTCSLDDPSTCAADDSCVKYAGLYADGDAVLAGLCAPSCSPVTQLTTDNESCGMDQGCFLSLFSSPAIGICARLRSPRPGLDEVITGVVSINSCNPGFGPIPGNDGNSICAAYCTPVESWSGARTNLGGEAPHDCQARGASAQHECRFASSFFAAGTSADPFLDTVGVCVNLAGRLYDSNNNGSPETPWPSCAALANTDTDGDGVRDHEKWGCAPVLR